jgi:hypothetical protein
MEENAHQAENAEFCMFRPVVLRGRWIGRRNLSLVSDPMEGLKELRRRSDTSVIPLIFGSHGTTDVSCAPTFS